MAGLRLGWAIIACALLLPGTAGAQVMTTKPNVTTGINTDCTGDRVQLTGFSMAPAQPGANQSVTVKLILKNACSKVSLNVPYWVADHSTKIATGTQTVPPGATVTISVPWTVKAGSHSLDAYLDETNTLNESATHQRNNAATTNISFTVAPPLVSMMLNFYLARDAGAQFAHNASYKIGCTEIGYRQPEITIGRQYTVLFQLQGLPPCGTAEPHAFANMKLKNGWRIKSVTGWTDIITSDVDRDPNVEWQWVNKPQPGSDDPFTKVRLTTKSPTKRVNAGFFVRIEIEGPQGTRPF